ncbi:MAG: hypothetical protein LBS45_01655 [Synergistaceae bacterium]|jgi:hypothetical protein|nr:hypothetical protein [Synergistaceae bacterium]
MKMFSKTLFVILCCAFFFSGKASAAWIVGAPYASPYWSSYGYYQAGVPAYAPPVYGPNFYAAPPIHYYAPAPAYVGRPVYYAPSGVYVRTRAYAVYPPCYPGMYWGY